jgi:RNA polymerase sigma factor (sigma-70 family)
MTDDRTLVAAVLAHERGAFARLVEMHQGLVWHLVQRMVNDAEDTRELCQEAFLRVHQRLAQFRFDAALRTWIGQIAFSVAARHLRRKRLPLVAYDESAGDDPALQVRDPVDVEARHADAQATHHLEAALAALPPVPRALVTLYHAEELGIPEIARITGLPEGTIKSHLFRTRKLLRDRLAPLLGDPA